MTKVLVFGSFDLLHKGHDYLFEKAKNLGDELYAVVARDSTIKKVKGKNPMYNENERLKEVQKSKWVDKAVLGNKGDKFKIVEKINPNVIVLGYDQNIFTDLLERKISEKNLKIKVIRLDAFKPGKYKSSLLKKS